MFHWIPLKFWFSIFSTKIKVLPGFKRRSCCGMCQSGSSGSCCCHYCWCCCCYCYCISCRRDIVLEDRGPGKPGLLVLLLTAQPRVSRPGPTSDLSGGQRRRTRTGEAAPRDDRAGTRMTPFFGFITTKTYRNKFRRPFSLVLINCDSMKPKLSRIWK